MKRFLRLIHLTEKQHLSTVEQAFFVDEPHKRYGMSAIETASRFVCSKAWMSLRVGILDEMSKVVREAVFSVHFTEAGAISIRSPALLDGPREIRRERT